MRFSRPGHRVRDPFRRVRCSVPAGEPHVASAPTGTTRYSPDRPDQVPSWPPDRTDPTLRCARATGPGQAGRSGRRSSRALRVSGPSSAGRSSRSRPARPSAGRRRRTSSGRAAGPACGWRRRAFTAAKSPMSARKIVVLTTSASDGPAASRTAERLRSARSVWASMPSSELARRRVDPDLPAAEDEAVGGDGLAVGPEGARGVGRRDRLSGHGCLPGSPVPARIRGRDGRTAAVPPASAAARQRTPRAGASAASAASSTEG